VEDRGARGKVVNWSVEVEDFVNGKEVFGETDTRTASED